MSKTFFTCLPAVRRVQNVAICALGMPEDEGREAGQEGEHCA